MGPAGKCAVAGRGMTGEQAGATSLIVLQITSKAGASGGPVITLLVAPQREKTGSSGRGWGQ